MKRGTPRDEASERDSLVWPASTSLLAVLATLAAVAIAAASLRWRRRSAGRLSKKPDSSSRLYPRARAGTVRGPPTSHGSGARQPQPPSGARARRCLCE